MIGTHRTTITTNDNHELMVCYHSTAVVTIKTDNNNNRYAVLKSGGWLTKTTKVRMNQASEEFKLNYLVFQKGWVWYVKTPEMTAEYYDGIVIDVATGNISKELTSNIS